MSGKSSKGLASVQTQDNAVDESSAAAPSTQGITSLPEIPDCCKSWSFVPENGLLTRHNAVINKELVTKVTILIQLTRSWQRWISAGLCAFLLLQLPRGSGYAPSFAR